MVRLSFIVLSALVGLGVLVVACGGGDGGPSPAVLSVSIVQEDLELEVDASTALTVTVDARGGASGEVAWSSSSGGVATVSAGGLVRGVAVGEATITARSVVDSSKSDSVRVTVVAADDPDPDPDPDPSPETGTVSGEVSVASVYASARSVEGFGLPAGEASIGLPGLLSGEAEFVVGEVIVGFAEDGASSGVSVLSVGGARLDVVRPLALEGLVLYRAEDLDADATLRVAGELQARADVVFAHPNYIARPLTVPDDPLYAQQWHFSAINLPAAWDITTGSAGTVVAVVDSGILYSETNPSLTHPDLVGKVLPGYDFVSSVFNSGDGTGRDPDPYQPGTGDHGTHVAGTIAAATDNGVGVAGVDWDAMILPVRVLGIDGVGSLADIVDGILWAAGFDVAGVPSNPNPAHVINLSIGGIGLCAQAYQLAFDRIVAESSRNAVVVAAAGNESIDAWITQPAGCRNVITVGATDFRGHRAWYSNFGTRIDVMAPGGDVNASFSGNLNDGVFSLVRGAIPGTLDYGFQAGTSMAAPHVAGVVSLMKALEPSLTLYEAAYALLSAARPLTPTECGRSSSRDCGFGLVDAAAALESVRDAGVPRPGVGSLVFEPSTLDFGAFDGALSITLRNMGSVPLAWEATQFLQSEENPGVMLDFAVVISDFSGSIPAGGTQQVDFEIDRSLVTADGGYVFAVVFEVDGEVGLLFGSFLKAEVSEPSLSGPMIVAAFLEGEDGELIEGGFQTESVAFSEFSFTTLAGDNWVVAWSDENDNLELDDGDFIGAYPAPVQVGAGEAVTGVDFELEPVSTFFSPSRASTPLDERVRDAILEAFREAVRGR